MCGKFFFRGYVTHDIIYNNKNNLKIIISHLLLIWHFLNQFSTVIQIHSLPVKLILSFNYRVGLYLYLTQFFQPVLSLHPVSPFLPVLKMSGLNPG